MVFDKLANVVTKHYKKIIVLWIVAVVLAVPAIAQVDNAVKYDISQSALEGYDSYKAQEIIEANFQQSVSNETMLIVLQSDNMTDVESRNFVLALQQAIMRSPELRSQYLDNVTSVYTYSSMVVQQYIEQLGPSMRPTEQAVGESAFLLWGIPAMYVSNYAEDPTDAYENTSAQLTAVLTQQGADAANTSLAFAYYNAFTDTWNASGADPSLAADPTARAEYCVNATAPTFVSSLPIADTEKAVMSSVVTGFGLTNFNDNATIRDFSLGLIGSMASIDNMTFLREVYDLGPDYTDEKAADLSDSIIGSGTLATYPVPIPEQLIVNFVSNDSKTMLFMVGFTVAADYSESGGDRPILDAVGTLRDIISDVKSETGTPVTTYVTGEAAIAADTKTSSEQDLGLIEPFTVIVIIALMGVLFRSVLGPFMPLGVVGIALGISQALVFVIGTVVAKVDYTVLTMLFSILMGVGTDYAVFIITRYREERIKGAPQEQAVHTSVTWAGESIVTSGATVVIAFMAMAISSFEMIRTMGLVLGMAIVVALLVALTLVPSVLMLVGDWVFWPTTGERWNKYAAAFMEKKKKGHRGYFHKAAGFSVDHAKVVLLAAILVSIPTAYAFMTTETSFDMISAMGDTESIDGMKAMTNDFGGGRTMPTQIVITGDTVVYSNETGFNMAYLEAIDNITMSIASNPLVQEVTGVTRPYGDPIDYRNLSTMSTEMQTQLVGGMLQSAGSDGRSILLTVVMKEQPMSRDSVDSISALRESVAAAQANEPALAGSSILVGGTTATLYDLNKDISTQFSSIEILVMIGIFVVLMIVLGSLLLPLFAIISIGMSITWSFALTYLVFGTWLDKPVLWIIPLVLFVMLMGIGMDYNVFILTRIREEAHKGKDAKTAVVDAVEWTGGIITALALIMTGAFAMMMISSTSMLQEFGFALTAAVLLDAMVVRTYIVPAAMALMGKWAWWAPGRLQRVGREKKGQDKEAGDLV